MQGFGSFFYLSMNPDMPLTPYVTASIEDWRRGFQVPKPGPHREKAGSLEVNPYAGCPRPMPYVNEQDQTVGT